MDLCCHANVLCSTELADNESNIEASESIELWSQWRSTCTLAFGCIYATFVFTLWSSGLYLFSPYHLVHYAHVALNDLHYLGGDIFIRVVWNRSAVVAVFDKFYCRVDGLEKSLGVDAGENKACLVERLGTFGRGADADCRERMTYAGEERTLLG